MDKKLRRLSGGGKTLLNKDKKERRSSRGSDSDDCSLGDSGSNTPRASFSSSCPSSTSGVTMEEFDKIKLPPLQRNPSIDGRVTELERQMKSVTEVIVNSHQLTTENNQILRSIEANRGCCGGCVLI